jgi:hypothetical protein
MDRFVTIRPQKINEEIIGRDVYLKNIKSLLESNASFCVYGDLGVGKSFLLDHVLHGVNHIELTSEMLKNTSFLERIKNTKVHVLLDELEVLEPLSQGSTIIISNKIVENFNCMKIEPLSLENIISIGIKKFPNKKRECIREAALESNGNLRNFLFSLDNFEDFRDLFMTPKDIVHNLVCKGGELNPSDYIGEAISEHGYTWGIIHENYLDANTKNFDSLADCMSIADIRDEDLYNGYSYASIFSLFGVIIPAISIDHTLDKESIRPGSAWTKFNNFKMRHHRYQSLTNRKISAKMDVDSLMVISQYCKTNQPKALEIMKSYGFETADIDMMNHISLSNKIKPRVLQNIKKLLGQALL